MLSLRWISVAVVITGITGVVAACADAPVEDDFNRRDNANNGEEDEENGSSSSGSSGKSSSSSSSGGTTTSSSSSSSSGSSTPADGGTSSGSPPATSSPTGACDPTAAPAQCTALDGKGGVCSGLARCQAGVATPTWGACQCGLVAAPITTTNDCLTFTCPPTAPNVVGCAITFKGDDSKGCAARNPATPGTAFFKEGDKCGTGGVGGTVFCSSTPPTEPLNAINCTMNKTNKLYPTTASSCP